MARKSGHNTRPKKKTKQARARIPEPSSASRQPGEPVAATNSVVSGEGAPVVEMLAPRSSAPRKPRPYQHAKQAPTARLAPSATVSISKAQEFAFIRNDLRRLLVTAGILVAIMIALLIVIDR